MKLLLAFLVLASLAHAAFAQAFDEKPLRELSQKFATAWNAGDAAAVAALYAPDAVLTTPGGTTVRGRKAIQDGVATDLKHMAGAKIAFSAEEFRPLGADAAIWRCEWTMKGMKDGSTPKGTGLAAVTRGPSGWLIVEDIAALSPAKPAAKPAGHGHPHGAGEAHDHGPHGHTH